MFKKLTTGFLCSGLLFAFAACGGGAASSSGDNSSLSEEPPLPSSVSSEEIVSSSEEESSEDIDDGRELVEDQLYTDSGLVVYFNEKGAKIKKIEYNTFVIAKDGDIKGRFANRIAGAEFELNGQTYQLNKNEGNNHLHGGKDGFGNCTWTKVEQTPSSITYSYHSADGEMGYPGNLDITVKYTLKQSGELIMEYFAKSDADTIFNPTNHIWLNLNGTSALNNHTLWLDADSYTETDSELIPTGNILPVEGTKYDFREELEFDKANKYDDNFVLNGEGYRKVARLTGEDLGVTLEISTDRPGFQIYNDNNFIVMETQLFPDAVHHDNFPSAVLKADTDFYSKSTYHFIVEE